MSLDKHLQLQQLISMWLDLSSRQVSQALRSCSPDSPAIIPLFYRFLNEPSIAKQVPNVLFSCCCIHVIVCLGSGFTDAPHCKLILKPEHASHRSRSVDSTHKVRCNDEKGAPAWGSCLWCVGRDPCTFCAVHSYTKVLSDRQHCVLWHWLLFPSVNLYFGFLTITITSHHDT